MAGGGRGLSSRGGYELHRLRPLQDVVTFLAWAAAPEHDERKLLGLKILSALSVALVTTVYWWVLPPCCVACRPLPARVESLADPPDVLHAVYHRRKRWLWAPLKTRKLVLDVVN